MKTQEKQYGYLEPIILPNEWTLGGIGEFGGEVLQPDGQWIDYLPVTEEQKKGIETSNCTGFATTSAVEILFERMGIEVNYSDRALGIAAGTYPPGNTPHKVAQAVRHWGLVPEKMLPFEDIASVAGYYSPDPLPDKILKEGKRFLSKYKFSHDWVITNLTLGDKKKKMMQALEYSPLGVSVQAWKKRNGLYYKDGRDNHWTICVGYKEGEHWLIFDSYTNEGSPLKKLEWDYDFGYVKRFSISPTGKKSFWQMILDWIYAIMKWERRLKDNKLAVVSH